jgi:hypothetical protein
MIWYDGAKTIAQKNTFNIPLKKLKVQAKNSSPPHHFSKGRPL